MSENSGNKTNDMLNQINTLNDIIVFILFYDLLIFPIQKQKELEIEQKKVKFEREISIKSQELNEMKIHLDQFQKLF